MVKRPMMIRTQRVEHCMSFFTEIDEEERRR
jgi:hypothetical protein